MDTPLFALDGAAFDVAGRTLLHPLSVTLAPRRVIGLIGHNGSGKSTLMKLLARQQPPSRGRIRFEGRDLAAWTERDFARRLAYLPQSPPAVPGLKVKELVAFGRYPWHGALGRVSALDRLTIDEAMILTDTAGFADRMLDTLSGGERQRAWLAMLLAQDTECLLLDEPISALDIGHQLQVLGLVRRLAAERGLTVIVVLHDINLAARFCDELVALSSGRLIARGTPREMLDAITLRDIYGIDMDVIEHPGLGIPVALSR